MYRFITKTFIALSFIISSSIYAGNTDGYDIKITAKGLKEGGKCLLANYYAGSQYKQDSGYVNAKGELEFKGTEKYPQGIYLIITPSRNYFEFVMDEGQHFSLTTDSTNYMTSMKIKGSEENQYFYDFQNFMVDKQKQIAPLKAQYGNLKKDSDSLKIIQDKLTVIDKEIKEYKNTFIKNHPKDFVANIFRAMEEPEIPEAPLLPNGKKDTTFAYHYYKAHFFDNLDFSDERLLRTPIFHAKIKQYMDKLTPQTPDSINIAVDYLVEKSKVNKEVYKYMLSSLTYQFDSSQIMGWDAIFVHIVDKYYETKQAPWVDSTTMYKIIDKSRSSKPVLLGKFAPQITMADSTGKMFSLSDFKAKYTLVVFWDQGCGHCQKEIPKLNDIYNEKLKALGVRVFSIETESNVKEWKKFLVKNKLNDWTNLYESDDYKRAVVKKWYYITSTPKIFLLDENKVIKAKHIDADKLEELIKMFDKEKEKAKK